MATQPPCRFMTAQQWICYLYSLIQDIEVGSTWQGSYPTSVALEAAVPVGEKPWFAWVDATDSFWFWSSTQNKWVNQNISEVDYLALSTTDRASVPYVII